jgi:ribonuclease P/MRP protein subunit RPP1
MQAFDLHIHSAFSGGESSLEEIANTAKILGYKGICFVAYPLEKREEGILRAEIERVRKAYGIDIYLGFEARNLRELKFLVKRRKEFDVLLVRGGDLKLNRKACETPEVNILTHPEFERQDSGLNHILVKLAAKNRVAIEINFREILISSKATRAKILAHMRKNIKLVKKFKAPLILCSGAISHFELRSPLSLISIATQLGLELDEAKKAISEVPKKIIEEIKKRKSGKWIMPGVEVIG